MEPIFLLTGLCCSFPRNCLSNSTPQNSHGIHYSLSQGIWSPYYILKILAMDCVLSCSIRQVCHQFYWFKQLSRMVKRAMPFYSLSLFFLAHSPHQNFKFLTVGTVFYFDFYSPEVHLSGMRIVGV